MKKIIRLTERDIHRIVKKCVNETINKGKFRMKTLNESADRFDEKAFRKWEEDTHIPPKIMKMINHIAEQVGCNIGDEETITLRNRGGYPYAYGKGFSMSHCTFSMLDGPSEDYSEEMLQWIKGLGFKIANSYGDNGMFPADSYGKDTYWTYEFIYNPSIVYEEQFTIWGDDEYDEYDDELDDW